MKSETAAAYSLLNAQAVRERAHCMLSLGLDDKLLHFRVKLDCLDDAAHRTLAAIEKSYPALDIPFHARWRHFVTNGCDRAEALAEDIVDPAARARAEFDLAIVSVLLDAGAGAQWHYRDPITGGHLSRSEGLAVASLMMFFGGAFSYRAAKPGRSADRLRADADAFALLDTKVLAEGFQVTNENPLVGLDGRAKLLRALGTQILEHPEVFAIEDSPRPGGFFDHLRRKVKNGAIPAPTILSELLQNFGPIWPSRLALGGVPLGDCWRHPLITAPDATDGFVPLHKLSQWLTYSLIEPLQRAGIAVTDIDGLTGLAEYRNGGLFVDTGVLAFRNPEDAARAHDVGSTLVVEWRALTVALLDRLAEIVRERLKRDAEALPLAKILEGGTWSAGRAIARELRPDGSPPVKVISDGTVF